MISLRLLMVVMSGVCASTVYASYNNIIEVEEVDRGVFEMSSLFYIPGYPWFQVQEDWQNLGDIEFVLTNEHNEQCLITKENWGEERIEQTIQKHCKDGAVTVSVRLAKKTAKPIAEETVAEVAKVTVAPKTSKLKIAAGAFTIGAALLAGDKALHTTGRVVGDAVVDVLLDQSASLFDKATHWIETKFLG